MGFFAKLKERLKKTRDAIKFAFGKLFTGGVLNDDFYDELEAALLQADIGAITTERILDDLRDAINSNKVTDRAKVLPMLKDIITDILTENEITPIEYPCIIMVSGVNGVGKTTAVGKLAHHFRREGKSVAIAAADTFRAAAADQLTVWAERAKARIIKHAEGADPGAVLFDAIDSAKAKNTDVLLVDTAGRLQNKTNLIEELKKLDRIIDRRYPEAQKLNYLVLDATTGQNALSQTDVFNDAISLDGIILNKLDGTAKGGVVIGICGEYSVPVIYAGLGEGIDDLEPFDAAEFAAAILE